MIVRLLGSIALSSLAVTATALSAPLAAQQQSADLRFPLDQEQRQANWDTVAAEVAAADRNAAGMAQDVRNLLRSQNIIDPYMANYGMSSADLGDVLALAQFSAVMLADGGRTDDPTQAQIDGIRAAIGGAAGPDLVALSASEKQNLADRLLYLIILQNAVAEALADQPALDAWMQAFASTNSEILGFDVTQVQVTSTGFATSPSAPSQSSAAGLAAGPAQSAGSGSQPAPTMGDGKSAVLGVGYQSTMVFVPGFGGGGLNAINTLTVLLQDGRACEDCLTEVLEGTLGQFAAENPDDMGRWRKVGAGYRVTWADGDTDDLEADDLHGPAPAGAKLNGSFKGVSGSSVGIASTLTIDYLDFRPDGSFVADGGTSSLGAYAIASVERAAQSGRYSIDGYRIIFEFANGAREESSFVLYDTDDEFVIIDGLPHYIPDDD
ncbi:MAG: hypothetical protein AAF250_14305 [Pseudomonadota bacterium]